MVGGPDVRGTSTKYVQDDRFGGGVDGGGVGIGNCHLCRV